MPQPDVATIDSADLRAKSYQSMDIAASEGEFQAQHIHQSVPARQQSRAKGLQVDFKSSQHVIQFLKQLLEALKKGCNDLDWRESRAIGASGPSVPRITSRTTNNKAEDVDQDPLEQLVNRLLDLNHLERQSSNISVLTNRAYYAFGEAYSKTMQVGQIR